MNNLVEANLHYLAQAEHLLAELSDSQFSRPSPSFYQSSIGGHLRHCLDHYDSFLNGLSDGKVDYDQRMREAALESETARATAKASEIREKLKAITTSSPPVGMLVKMDCGMDAIDWQPSTIGRELQFLISHTVHHFAMIGGICKEFGITPEANFGVAPSTIRHHADCSA